MLRHKPPEVALLQDADRLPLRDQRLGFAMLGALVLSRKTTDVLIPDDEQRGAPAHAVLDSASGCSCHVCGFAAGQAQGTSEAKDLTEERAVGVTIALYRDPRRARCDTVEPVVYIHAARGARAQHYLRSCSCVFSRLMVTKGDAQISGDLS
jgi:hypothetical protein